jgi:aminomethyltransferase
MTHDTMPAEFDGIDVEYARLRSDRGLIDWRGSGVCELEGAGALPLLEKLCTRSPGFLLEERTLAALMLDESGTMISEVLVACHADRYTVEVQPGQHDVVWQHLSAHATGHADVHLRDITDDVAIFGVEGPHAAQTVQPFLDSAIGELAYKSFTITQWRGHPVFISRTGVTAEFGYKLRIAAEHGEDLRARLIELGALPCGGDAVSVCRLESRFASLEDDSPGPACTPFELALQWMVDFDHQFLGREVLLQRWQQREIRHPVCFVTADGASLCAGDDVLADGEVVGQLTNLCWSPGLRSTVGLAHVDAELAASGLDLVARGDSGMVGIRTCSGPFLLPASLGAKQA